MNYNFTHIKGDTFQNTLYFKDKNSNPIDITGSEITFSIKKNIEDVDYIIQKTATLTNPSNGEAEIKITNTEMQIEDGIYYYDIQWKDTNLFVRTFLRGAFTIIYQIT